MESVSPGVSSGSCVGRVADVRRYPLRSAAGESVPQAQVTLTGLAGDRRWVVRSSDGALTGKRAPQLRDVVARFTGDGVRLDVGGERSLAEHEAAAALTALLGVEVELLDAVAQDDGSGDGSGDGRAAVHVVSVGAHADPDAPGGCDPDPRANLVLDLDGGPGAERGWVGRAVQVGEDADAVVLRVTRTPAHCLGVYAEVERPGTARRGDRVVLLPPR